MDPDNPNDISHTDPVEDVARSLFGEPNPVIEAALNSDLNQEPAEPVEPTEPVAPVEPVEPVTPVVEEPPATLTKEELEQFRLFQQQQKQTPPVLQQQQQTQQPATQPAVQQQQQAPVQLSDEEVARLTNRFVVDEKVYDEMFATEDKAASIAAFNKILQGAVRQAVTMASYLHQDGIEKVHQTVRPYMQFADSQREIALRETFFAKHPDLRGADVVIKAVQDEMTRKGQRFQTVEELFDATAKASKAHLAQLQASGQQPKTVQQQPAVKPRMATITNGSGGGGSGQQTAVKSGSPQETARAIFG